MPPHGRGPTSISGAFTRSGRALIVVLAAFTAGVLLTRLIHSMTAPSARGLEEIASVRALIRERYVREVDDRTLVDGALRGMVDSLDDPYSLYVPASESKDFDKALTGEYAGIGAEVTLREGWLTIATPMDDSPALRAGLLPEDRVLAIDGTSTQGLEIDACVRLLTGEAGTTVSLSIERAGQPIELTLTRARIKARAVKGIVRDGGEGAWNYLLDAQRGVALIRITTFTPGVAQEVASAIDAARLQARGELRGLIIDLRFNGGGLLNEAEQLADLFLSSGTIVSTRGRAHENRTSVAREAGTIASLPLVVLVNGESASASEVLAGALQDNGRAKIAGERTFGKGSVQSVLRLGDASVASPEIKLTEQRYYLPSGRSIQREDDSPSWGVDPDPGLATRASTDDLIEMVRVRRRLELLGTPVAPAGKVDEADTRIIERLREARWDDGEWVLEMLRDPQLAHASSAVASYLDTGVWPQTADATSHTTTIASDEIVKLRNAQERLLRELDRTQRRMSALEGVPGAESLADSRNDRDLWKDSPALRGGIVEVRDREGSVVSRLRITRDDLERWLIDAGVERAE